MSKTKYKEYLVELINQIIYMDLSRTCVGNGGIIGGCLGGDACEDCDKHVVDNYDFTILVKMAKRVKEEIKKDTQTEELQ